MMGSFSSMACIQGEPPLSAGASLANSDSAEELARQAGKNVDTVGDSETLILDGTAPSQPMDDFQRSLAKMEEFRQVAPVPGLGSFAPVQMPSSKLAPPPAGSRKKSLNGSFRARRLKEIKTDNAEVFERIRKSVSHYRNDDLRREWQQNLSYLSSISEFPVAADALASPTKQQYGGEEGRSSCFGPSPRRPSFLRATTRAEPLPSIPVVPHPIKFIPTSPKKLQLNMSPAFRSLRKAMPQQPSLPPISSPHSVLSAADSVSSMNNKAPSSPRNRSTSPSRPASDTGFPESMPGRSLPYRSSTAIAATKFIGDLHGRQAESEVSGDAKYQLLKTGRFVGGTYLVLTVFCGDGVMNPYGFDVFAYHRELQCEYKLSITKEMTHELLDKSSSSSLAAETAAAAGTNLSMQEIARSICDHVNFALLGADQGEMVFLAPSVGRKSARAMRFDASPKLVAFCLHQTVEIGDLEGDEVQGSSGSSARLVGSKRKAHIFASTCPPTSHPGGMKPSTADGNTKGFTVYFQLMDSLPPSRCTASSESIASCKPALHVEASVDELYTILFEADQARSCMLSVDRMAVAAIQHLHIISVPSGDDVGTLRNELIVNAHVNTLLHPSSSRPTGTSTLEKKRSRQQLPHSTSQLFTQPIRSAILLQSGLVWRNGYLVAEVSLDQVDDDRDEQPSRRQRIQDVDCDLIVSVFNSNSAHSSWRRLSRDKVATFSERMEVLARKSKPSSGATGASIRDRHSFAEELVTCLQLDVDLFGQEVIVFPTLEFAAPLSAASVKEAEQRSPGKWPVPGKETDFVSPEVLVQEFLPRRASWEEENISEGDEAVDSDAYDEDAVDELNGQPYDTDEEEERDEADESYSSYANQDEADLDAMDKSIEECKPHERKGQDAPEKEEDADQPGSDALDPIELGTRRRWRRGSKIDGRFCLLKGSPDDVEASTVYIASLGQLRHCRV
jgi:hypothetical protein